jgi:hypothetical protein
MLLSHTAELCSYFCETRSIFAGEKDNRTNIDGVGLTITVLESHMKR